MFVLIFLLIVVLIIDGCLFSEFNIMRANLYSSYLLQF